MTRQISQIETLRKSGLYCHSLPGRLRIEVPGLKQNGTRALELERSLMALPGVTAVETNLVTGRVLLAYCPERADLRSLPGIIRGEAMVKKSDPPTRRSSDLILAPASAASIGNAVGSTLLKLATEFVAEKAILAVLGSVL